MSNTSSARVPLIAKLLVMFLPVILVSNILIGVIAYRISAKGMTTSVNNHLTAVSTDLANQIAAINDRQFQVLHSVAAMEFIKDESVPLAEKARQLSGVAAAIGGNCENIAFYDKDGNALTADGRLMNFASRPYFSEAFAGKDFVSDPTFSTITNSVLQHYSVPVYNGGRIVGAVVAVISGNTVQDTIASIDLGGGMHPSVINSKTRTTVANVNEGTESSDRGATLDDT